MSSLSGCPWGWAMLSRTHRVLDEGLVEHKIGVQVSIRSTLALTLSRNGGDSWPCSSLL